MKILCGLLAVCMMLTGCQKSAVPVHPGSISSLDSYAYDILLVEQEAINTAKVQYAAGQLPPEAKDPLNAAIKQYNATEDAWQTYHATGQGQDKLQQAMTLLIAAVGELQKVLQKPAPTPVQPADYILSSEVLAWAS